MLLLKRLLIGCGCLLLLSCASLPVTDQGSLVRRSGQGFLTVYLTSSGPVDFSTPVEIAKLEIEVNDAWIDLDLPRTLVDYQQLKGQQKLLGASVAPVGQHQRLRIQLRGLPPEAGGNEDGELALVVDLPEPLELNRDESKCLFLEWQLVPLAPGSTSLTPRFLAWGQGQVLGGELLYVACKNIDTIYLVRMDISEVVASFAVPGPLEDIRVAQNRMYILSSGRRSIFVYDCLNARLIDQIVLPGSLSPEHMVLSETGRYAFVSDATGGAVFKIDLQSGRLVAQARVGHHPQRLAYSAAGQKLLAVSAPSSHQVFLLSAEDLTIQRILPVGIRPAGLIFFDGALYIAEGGSRSVAKFDYRTGQQSISISVGSQPDDLLAIDRNTAFVSNSGNASLSVLHAGQNTALRRVPTAANPTEIEFSKRKQLVYVQHPAEKLLSVLDRSSLQMVESIALSATPRAMAILE